MAEPIRDVLLLVADQWRADALGVLGTPGVDTPNLDALARRSVVFDNHWCQASPCGPARSSLLTGTETTTHRQWTNADLADHGLETLPETVSRGGLTPLLIGYTDTPQSAGRAPGSGQLHDPAFEVLRPFFWQEGFVEYREALKRRGYASLSDDMMGIFPPSGRPTAARLAPSAIAAPDSDVAWLTDAAIDALRHRPEPQLLHLNWWRPHPPLVPPAPYHQRVDPDAVALPSRPLSLQEQLEQHPFFDFAAGNRPMSEYVQRRSSIESIDEGDERRIRAAYYGLCAEVDHHVGRVLTELRATGRDRTTLIVFLSDHGDAMGDHWLYGRRGPFDDHFRVPCIVHDPRPEADATRGVTIEAFTANIDVPATILDCLDLPAPSTIEGRSLLPFIQGTEPSSWRTGIRLHMDWTDQVNRTRRAELNRTEPDRFSVVRTDRHRYVEFSSFEPMLFDLHDDPHEVVNRAGEKSGHRLVAELKAQLDQSARWS